MNARRIVRAVAPTLRYWMLTEVHVYAFSIAANVLLSFFPFLIIAMSLGRPVFGNTTTVAAIDFIFRDYFPGALSQFLHSEAHNNLPQGRPIQVVSLVLLLFTANGIFQPLEVALNRVWGIRKDRSFFRNQLVSLALIFACGGLALLSFGVTALHQESLKEPNVRIHQEIHERSTSSRVQAFVEVVFLKIAALPLAALILFLIYRYLPNGKPPLNRVIPAAIGVGLLLEALKYVNILVWPRFQDKIAREYGVFQYSVTLIFLGFFTSLLVLAGAEWAARDHRLEAARGHLEKDEGE